MANVPSIWYRFLLFITLFFHASISMAAKAIRLIYTASLVTVAERRLGGLSAYTVRSSTAYWRR